MYLHSCVHSKSVVHPCPSQKLLTYLINISQSSFYVEGKEGEEYEILEP